MWWPIILVVLYFPVLNAVGTKAKANKESTSSLWLNTVLRSILSSSSFTESYYYNPDSACHLMVYGSSESDDSNPYNNPDLFVDQKSSKILSTRALARPPWNALRSLPRSPNCYHILVVTSALPLDMETWVTSVLQGLLHRPEYTQFVFVGLKNEVTRTMSQRAVDSLNFKISVAIDTRQVTFPSPMFRINLEKSIIETLTTPTHSGYKTRNAVGQVMRVGIFKLEPHVVNSVDKKPIMGTSYNMLRDASQYFNFTLDIEQALQGFGQWPNGTWQGFMGDLVEHRKDVLCIIGHVESRHKVVDFSSYVYMIKLHFYTSHPVTNLTWKSVFYPFDGPTWAAIVLTVLVTIPVMYIHLRVRLGFELMERESRIDTLWEAASVICGFLLQESMKIPPRAQFIVLLFVFGAIVLDTCYNSNLISCLTFPAPDPYPKTFKDLARMRNSYNVTMMSFKGGAATLFVDGSTNADVVKLREKLTYVRIPAACLTDAAANPKTVCIAWRFLTVPIAASNVSVHSQWDSLTESRDSVYSITVNLGLQRYSKYYLFWNYVVASLRETGHFSQWEKTVAAYLKHRGTVWMTERRLTTNATVPKRLQQLMKENTQSTLKPFEVENFIVAFAVIGIGAMLSSASFFYENLPCLYDFLRSKVSGGYEASVIGLARCYIGFFARPRKT